MSTTMTRDATQDGMTAERGVGKHTDGPWELRPMSYGYDLWNGGWFVELHSGGTPLGPDANLAEIDATFEADARLIAAAPDYDAAARLMVRTLGCAPDEVVAGAFGTDVLDALNGLRAAIAKTQQVRS